LKYWLGLFEDFKKILVNTRLEFILTRSHTDLNALSFKSGITAFTAKVVLNKIVWRVPHITVEKRKVKIIETC